jgi:flagellar hook-associated protein 3 FlgL
MISSLTASENSFLFHLSRLEATITTASAQVTSGHRIGQPSDAPDQISPLLQLQASLGHNQSVEKTLTRVEAEMQTADSGISTAIQSLDQALSVATQGASSTATAATRANLADQIQSLQSQLVGIANTKVAGRYIFSGNQDAAPPYALNLNQLPAVPQNGVDRLLTLPVTATRQIELSSRVTAAVDQTSQDLFDHRNADDSLATDNVFAALNALRVALTKDDEPGIKAAQISLQTAATYLNSQEGFYGTVLTRISSAKNQLESENSSLQQQISSIRDTDVVQAALQLSSAVAQNQAALAAESKRPRTTLFDYLG